MYAFCLVAIVLVSGGNAFAPTARATLATQRKSLFNLLMASEYALLFDCDGVIVETEELHRIAYNKAFNKFGLKLPSGVAVEWDTKYCKNYSKYSHRF